jgi:hypothetical protein
MTEFSHGLKPVEKGFLMVYGLIMSQISQP